MFFIVLAVGIFVLTIDITADISEQLQLLPFV